MKPRIKTFINPAIKTCNTQNSHNGDLFSPCRDNGSNFPSSPVGKRKPTHITAVLENSGAPQWIYEEGVNGESKSLEMSPHGLS